MRSSSTRCARPRSGRRQTPTVHLSAESVRRPGATPVHRPDDRGRAGRGPDGRARLGLDPIATAAIEDLMRKLRPRYTIVIVTHNMQQATRVSDRTAFFSVRADETRIIILVEYGPTQQIFGDPTTPHPGPTSLAASADRALSKKR